MAFVDLDRRVPGRQPQARDGSPALRHLAPADRGVLERASPRDIPREVVVAITPRGHLLTESVVQIFRELDEELAAFIGTEALVSLWLVFEAARALGVPGTAADL